MTTSPDLGIPFIAESQSQPNVIHNEAILALQVLALGVIDRHGNTPAVGPADGDAYIVGTVPTGAWAGRANCIAYYLSGWRFIAGNDSDGTPITMGAAQEGLRVFVQAENRTYTWTGAAWLADPRPDTYAANAVDADFTLTPLTSAKRTRSTATLGADRAVTLSTTSAVAGDSFRITRTGGGAFNLNVGTGPLKALATNTWCEVTYDGAAWFLSAYGAL